jgi:hypothetical protein
LFLLILNFKYWFAQPHNVPTGGCLVLFGPINDSIYHRMEAFPNFDGISNLLSESDVDPEVGEGAIDEEIIHGQLVASDAGLHLDGMHDEVEQSPVGDELLQEGPNANIIVDLDVVPVHLLVKHVATVRIALLLQLLHVEGQRRYCVEQLHDLRLVLDVNVTQVLQVDVLALVPPVHANTVLVLHVGRQAQLLHPAQGVGVLPGQPGGPVLDISVLDHWVGLHPLDAGRLGECAYLFGPDASPCIIIGFENYS